jgi:F0F1-type ATP synthase membrane subunit b/b'
MTAPTPPEAGNPHAEASEQLAQLIKALPRPDERSAKYEIRAELDDIAKLIAQAAEEAEARGRRAELELNISFVETSHGIDHYLAHAKDRLATLATTPGEEGGEKLWANLQHHSLKKW